MDTTIHTPATQDKSLWVAILASMIPLVNAKFGLGLDVGSLIVAVSSLSTFIAASKWKQTVLTKAQIEAAVPDKAAALAEIAKVTP